MYDTGLFVVPFEDFYETCFRDISVAHNRERDGFVDRWYDKFDAGREMHFFNLPTSSGEDIYLTAETYSHNVVPMDCTTGFDKEMNRWGQAPVAIM